MTKRKLIIQHVPVSKLPASLYRDAIGSIASYSISLVASDQRPESQQPCAGVLTAYGNLRGFLTARHVAESVKRATTLSLLVGHRQFRIKVDLLSPKHPAPIDSANLWEAALPDLSFIPLPPYQIANLEAAGKAFYGVDRRTRDDAFDLRGEDGFFFAIGSPDQMADRENGQLVQLRFATDVAFRTEIHGWDYVAVNMNLDENPALPKSLEGMSGGGVWRVRFQVDANDSYVIRDVGSDVTLNGIVCLQTNAEPRQLVAHGAGSIYSKFPAFLALK